MVPSGLPETLKSPNTRKMNGGGKDSGVGLARRNGGKDSEAGLANEAWMNGGKDSGAGPANGAWKNGRGRDWEVELAAAARMGSQRMDSQGAATAKQRSR